MLNKDDTLEYNYKILSQERKKQKISQENVSSQLTLSLGQIKSLENNLNTGFVTPHFKSLALKRYTKFLGIDFDKIITPPDLQQEVITNYVTKEEVSEVYIKNSNILKTLKLKIKGNGMATVIVLIVLALGLLFTFTRTDNFDENAPSLEITTPNLSISKEKNVDINVNDMGPLSANFIKNKKIKTTPKKDIQEIKNTPITLPIEFICSIESASMDKVWSRVNPEKPPNYFHIVSLKKQSVCFIDNQGVLKQYDLAEGGKITPRGEAPFKVQLNPSISELYFQGWKVYLEENDSFIQLNPVDMAIELN